MTHAQDGCGRKQEIVFLVVFPRLSPRENNKIEVTESWVGPGNSFLVFWAKLSRLKYTIVLLLECGLYVHMQLSLYIDVDGSRILYSFSGTIIVAMSCYNVAIVRPYFDIFLLHCQPA